MNPFDSLIKEMDTELFNSLGGGMTLLDKLGGPCPVQATLDLDLQQLVDGQLQYLGPVITINQPPRSDLTGYTVMSGGCRYTLRERITFDGFVVQYAVTAESGPR